MSLAVWLPLNGSLENQGYSTAQVTNNGATIDDNGKIGKCYYFDGTDDRIYANNVSISNTAMSACAWVKFTTLAPNNYPYIFALGSNTSGPGIQLGLAYWKSDSKIHLVGHGYEGASTYTPPINTWIHLCITIKGSESKLYVNGVLTSTLINSNSPKTQTCLCIGARPNSTNGGGVAFSYPMNGYINDFRLYDHALSPLEVKEIAQGLVLHYKLDDLDNENFFNYTEIIPENNVYTNPTFTSSSGWSHWGPSGHSGTYGQNSDKQYIFNKNNSYSHYLSEENGTGKYFLLYQVPDSPGGPRSLQCIIKEENSVPITSGVVWPSLNSRTGGAAAHIWTSIKYLGDGFYYCKYENVIQSQQTGVNALFGIGVSPGYKVYISEMYLENSENCTSIFNNNTIVYDSSGYNNNGTIVGTATTSSDTARYSSATVMNATSTTNHIECTNVLPSTIQTISCWIKNNGSTNYVAFVEPSSGLMFAPVGNMAVIKLTTANATGYAISSPYYVNGEWNHIVVQKDGDTYKLWTNGIQRGSSGSNYYLHNGDKLYLFNRNYNANYASNCIMSDFRAYCTLLSEADIKLLYSAGARADNLGGLHVQEFEEGARKGITTQRILHSSNFFENGYLELLHYDKNVYTEPDGTTWVHIFHHNDPTTNGLFASTDTFETSVYKNEHKWYDIEPLMANMPMYEFMVKQKTTSSATEAKYRWIQNVNPLEATWADVKPGTVTFNTSSGYTSSSYGGLWKMNSNARMCIANGSSGNWYGALGSWTVYNTNQVPGFPNTNISTGYIDLYIRIYTPIKFIKDTGTNALNFIEI